MMAGCLHYCRTCSVSINLLLAIPRNFVTYFLVTWRRQWHSTPVLCLENPMDGGAWWATQSMGLARSQTRLKRFISNSNILCGLSWWLSSKESTCQCRRLQFDPWVGKIPWRRKWQPTPVFLPWESQGRGAWWAAIYGVAQSWTWLKWLSSSSWPLKSFKVRKRQNK